jgi:hypothetical protein
MKAVFMKVDPTLSQRIEDVKALLALTAKQHNFDFQHPSVLYISQKLDELILHAMKNSASFSPISLRAD